MIAFCILEVCAFRGSYSYFSNFTKKESFPILDSNFSVVKQYGDKQLNLCLSPTCSTPEVAITN